MLGPVSHTGISAFLGQVFAALRGAGANGRYGGHWLDSWYLCGDVPHTTKMKVQMTALLVYKKCYTTVRTTPCTHRPKLLVGKGVQKGFLGNVQLPATLFSR